MSALLPFALGLLCLLLQELLGEAFALDMWTPDLLSVVILWLGIHRGLSAQAAVIAALLGLLADGFALSPVGLHALHALLLFHLAALIGGQARFTGLAGRLLLGGLGGLASVALLAGLGRVFLGDTLLAERLGQLLFARVALILLTAPILFALLDRLDRALVHSREGQRL